MKPHHPVSRTDPRRSTLCFSAALLLPLATFGDLNILSTDFSASQNPNPPWSLNLNGAPLAGTVASSHLVGWGYSPSFDASITRVASIASGWETRDVFVGDILIHTASTPGDAISITWTSPGQGTIDVSGAAWNGYFYSGRDAGWSLILDGTALAGHDSVYDLNLRTDPAAVFANDVFPGQTLNGLSVSAGDVLTFLTVTKPGNSGHFMAVEITVDFQPSIPEAPTVLPSLGLMMLIGVVVCRRRFRPA